MNTKDVFPGFEAIEPSKLEHPLAGLADSPAEWRAIFHDSIAAMTTFFRTRDPHAVLARCAYIRTVVSAGNEEMPRWVERPNKHYLLMVEPELEIAQALALTQPLPHKSVPASPGSMHRFFSTLVKSTYSFTQMHHSTEALYNARAELIFRIRQHTVVYRNIFTMPDCEEVVQSIFERLDELCHAQLGFAITQVFSLLIAIKSHIEERLTRLKKHVGAGLTAESKSEALDEINFLCSISPAAARAWSKCSKHCNSLEDFRLATFLLSELSYSWAYSIDKSGLKKEFGEIAEVIENLSIPPGGLSGANIEHFFMDNPVWRKPFISMDDHTFFLPIPTMVYSFPFRILETLFEGNERIKTAYESARASYLEEAIAHYLGTGLPSAQTFRRVMWHDKTSGKTYENDLLVILGNTLFLFEAKSGKLGEAARRGAEKSLETTIKELFVAPAQQAARLEAHLNLLKDKARLWSKDSGETITLDLERPKVVYKFVVCIEHFASISSTKENLRQFIDDLDEKAWAPVLSIGELILMWRFLDSEISLFHYLTRRATLEEELDFVGDDNDILSTYLTNGLYFDRDETQNKKVYFFNADSIIQEHREPRSNRTEFDTKGIRLSRYWKLTLEEIYRVEDLPHRFDIIRVLLNQDPTTLKNVDRIVRRWKSGRLVRRNGDTILLRQEIGERAFIVAYHLVKWPVPAEEWKTRSRAIAIEWASSLSMDSDCAVFLRVKKSDYRTFDAVSFFRLGRSRG